ncbi:MAG: hypothetical protein SGJ20_21440 [Planctomycetota bacterium]|nr:hypothetical protein [Planctomycetota bacterium]
MWRSFFLAAGIFTLILGVECMLIERAVRSGPGEDIIPPEWAPWSLMSAGAVVILYSFTIPKKLKG